MEEPLAGKSTLNRLELTPAESGGDRYHKITYSAEPLDRLRVEVFLEAHPQPPAEIVLDRDVTDTPLQGEPEARFFHGYYRDDCYRPLYIFCGERRLCARPRASNQEASAGAFEEVERMVRQIRQPGPEVKMTRRADSGFCREELMSWGEAHAVDYVFGRARKARLEAEITAAMAEAQQQPQQSGPAARVFTEFFSQTRQSWSRARRVIAKAEYLAKGENPRLVVTSLVSQAWPARALYEQLYCARGEMENRIQEQLSLFADRMSPESLRAHQLRLYFSSFASVLLHALRRLALAGTEWAHAQVGTIRLRLLNIAAAVRWSARRIGIRSPRAYPGKARFAAAHSALRC